MNYDSSADVLHSHPEVPRLVNNAKLRVDLAGLFARVLLSMVPEPWYLRNLHI